MRRLDRDTENRVSPTELVKWILDELEIASRSDYAELTLTFQRGFKPSSEFLPGLGVRVDFGRVYTIFERRGCLYGPNHIDDEGVTAVLRVLSRLIRETWNPDSKVGQQVINFARNETQRHEQE